MLGTAIKEARGRLGITQADLAENCYLSDKTISAIETGRRGINTDTLKYICKRLDNPRTYLEAIDNWGEGIFTPHWLDGQAADLHRASVKEKTIEELSEAIRAINLVKTYKNPDTCGQEERKVIERSIQETIDAFNACAIYVAIICEEFGFSVKDEFNIQRQKLIERGYMSNTNDGNE